MEAVTLAAARHRFATLSGEEVEATLLGQQSSGTLLGQGQEDAAALSSVAPCETKTFVGSDGVERSTTYVRLDAKVLDLDLSTHSFVISGNMNLFWYDDHLLETSPDAPTGSLADGDYPKVYALQDNGLNIPVNPEMPFSSMEDIETIAPPKLLFDPKTSLAFYTFSFKARLGARLNLERFPFDRFRLSVRINLRSSQFHLSPAPFAAVPAKWYMRIPTNIWLSQLVADEYIPREGYACVWDCSKWKPSAVLYLERRPDQYIWNAFFPLFLIVLISACAHVIPFDELANRANLSVTLLLTQFALKFALSGGLPNVPYRTFMDDYFLAATLVISFNFFVASFTSVFAAEQIQAELDAEGRIRHFMALPLCVLMLLLWGVGNVYLTLNLRQLYRAWSDLEGKGSIESMDLAEVKTMQAKEQ